MPRDAIVAAFEQNAISSPDHVIASVSVAIRKEDNGLLRHCVPRNDTLCPCESQAERNDEKDKNGKAALAKFFRKGDGFFIKRRG